MTQPNLLQSCAYCGDTDGPFHLDHVVPRSRGGPDSPENLIVACAVCNREKHDRLPSEWLETVPDAVAAIEIRVTAKVGGKIRARREWNAKRQSFIDRAKQKAAGKFPCFFCGASVTMSDGFLSFHDEECGTAAKRERGVRFLANGGRKEFGALSWPGNGPGLVASGAWTDYKTIAILSHSGCGPDGYWFPLDRIKTEHKELRRHVSKKKWWFLDVEAAFDWALQAAGGTP